jgi:hypothetical protein
MSSVIFNAHDYFRFQKRKILRIEDYEAVRDNCTECSEVGAMLNRSTNVVYNGHSSNNTGVRGYTWTMLGAEQHRHRAGPRLYPGRRRSRHARRDRGLRHCG